MKICLGIISFCLALASGQSGFQCPVSGSGCLDGTFPHPTQCTAFYSCFNCIFYKQDCPAGLHFSSAFGYCVQPADAFCGVSTTTGPTGPTTVAGSTTEGPSTTQPPVYPPYTCPSDGAGGCLDGIFANPYNCVQYYQCVTCRSFLRDCPAPLHFSPVTKNCIQPEVAMCQSTPLPLGNGEFTRPQALRPQPTRRPFNTDDSAAQQMSFQCPSDGAGGCQSGNFPNALDCTRYWACANCLAFAMQCPAGLNFSPITQNCIRPEQANCIVSTTSPSPQTTPSTTPTPTSTPTTTTLPTTPTTTSTTLPTTPTTTPTTQPTTATPTTVPTTPTTTPTTPPNPNIPAVVGVARTSNLNEIMDPVPFNSILANLGGHFNNETSLFSPPANGVYLFSYSAGAAAGEKVDFNLLGTAFHTGIKRSSTTHNGADTLSREFIMGVTSEALIKMASSGALYSDAEIQTSLNLFSLDRAMTRPLVAFQAARDNNLQTAGIINFPRISLRSGDGWQGDDQTFKAPVDGIYYFSISTGAQAGYPHRVHIQRNGRRLVELWRGADNHNGQDTLSRATLVELAAGDTVSVGLKSGFLYSDGLFQTSFMGFLYQPASVPTVAWSVHRTSSWASVGSPLYPVNFGTVFVNTNRVYDTSAHRVLIPVTGYYFIHLDVGARPYRQVNFDLVLDDLLVLADIYRDSNTHNGDDTLSRGVILRLTTGSSLAIRAAAGTSIYSDSDIQTSFSGFLISAD